MNIPEKKIEAYKSLEAYNYFASDWVGTCLIHEVNGEFSVLMKCRRHLCGQVNVLATHLTLGCCEEDEWCLVLLIAHTWANIWFCYFNCYSSDWLTACFLDETCSHIAAWLFLEKASVWFGYTNLPCTSRPCTWNQAFSKKVSVDQCYFKCVHVLHEHICTNIANVYANYI